MFTIIFRFESGEPVTIDANAGEKLLDVARKANVAIDAPCSGNGVCGKCRVRLVSGYLDAPINRHITSEEYAAGWRLACLAQISGDAEIEVPDIASAYRSRMKMADLSSPEEIAIFEDLRAQLEAAGVAFGSDLHFLPLTLSEPTLDDTMPDNERLLRAIEAAAGVDESRIILPYSVLRDLSRVLRDSAFSVKCVISRDQDRVLIRDVLPQDSAAPLAQTKYCKRSCNSNSNYGERPFSRIFTPSPFAQFNKNPDTACQHIPRDNVQSRHHKFNIEKEQDCKHRHAC